MTDELLISINEKIKDALYRIDEKNNPAFNATSEYYKGYYTGVLQCLTEIKERIKADDETRNNRSPESRRSI